MKRTKIVCTIGPSSNSLLTLRSMMRGGMDAARLNLSHGTHVEHSKLLRNIRSSAKSLGFYISVIADLQGPKIRIGELPKEGIMLKTHETYVFSTTTDKYTGKSIPVTYKNLHKDVRAGDRFLIDDGLVELKIEKVSGKEISAKVINGGFVTSHKGMNFPNSRLSVSSITEKDKDDIKFAVSLGVDWIALSFVRSSQDVKTLKRLIRAAAGKAKELPKIIVKIEKHEAIDAFDEILKETDGVMIARGDLGVEIPAQEVPIRQKELIEKCRVAGKPVIVATQMLDSMIRNPSPTRAEVSDVANAVFDHTDAVMLSGETATGKYPVKAVKTMSTIVKEAEGSKFDDVIDVGGEFGGIVETVAKTIKLSAKQGAIDGILASIELADWAETVNREHAEIPLFIACPTDMLARQTVLRWGSVPFIIKKASEKTFITLALRMLKSRKWVKKGMMLAVIVDGKHGKSFDVVGV